MKLPPHCAIQYGTKEPSIPDDGKGQGYFTRSFDDRLWLFHRRWTPAANKPVIATLMIVHGTVDHSGHYHELATRLNDLGIAVIAPDMRGWGHSDGERLYVDDLKTLCADVENLYQTIHASEPYQSVSARFLLGKSLGGTVAAVCVDQYPSHWTGLLGLSGAFELGPAIGQPNFLKWSFLIILAYFLPKLPFKKLFDEHFIVADPGALESWRRDPLCSHGKVTVGYAINLILGVRSLSQCTFSLPMLMMVGDDDNVVLPQGHEHMLQWNASTDKEIHYYPRGRHNLLLEPTLKDQVMMDIAKWIKAHS